MKTIMYDVTGMTCGGCVNRVNTALQPFATEVAVTLDPPQAKLTNPTANLAQLNQALSNIGHYSLSTTALPLEQNSQEESTSWVITYRPLLLVFAYITLVSLMVEWRYGNFELHRFMPNFMAGFFLTFSFFKLLDLAGFASSYAMYDVLAKRVPQYGYVYPFIELALGIGYLLAGNNLLVNGITFIVMTFSTVGVLIAVSNRQKIRCACLGAVFNLPMSTVTIVEDVLMAGMALWMILTML
ncbi:MAG: heavy-metal-associated domain-containing protein [Methylophilus sp.]|nr:heavy-metal-associated domain-containing protein [Methylophilus sp.]